MTLYEMLEEIIEKGVAVPGSGRGAGVCYYCNQYVYGDGHAPDCVWKLAEEFIEKQEE